MEPRIQYAKTSDGISIAFSTLGSGPPLVMTPRLVWGHLRMNWENPHYRSWANRVAENRRLIAYNHSGSGLSDREVTDFSLGMFAVRWRDG